MVPFAEMLVGGPGSPITDSKVNGGGVVGYSIQEKPSITSNGFGLVTVHVMEASVPSSIQG